MNTVTVYGASDDLIEIEGAMREEFYYDNYRVEDEEGDNLVFSDGTVLRIRFSARGVWRIAVVHYGSASITLSCAPDNDGDNYSDRCTLTGNLEWVVHGNEKAER